MVVARHPADPTRWLLPAFARFWRGYADEALRNLEEILREHPHAE